MFDMLPNLCFVNLKNRTDLDWTLMVAEKSPSTFSASKDRNVVQGMVAASQSSFVSRA